MAEDLRPLAQEWCAHWACVADGAAIVTDDAFLLPVRRDGIALMLKVVDPQGDEMGAGAMLLALAGHRAVRVLAQDGPALLMERLVAAPGYELAAMALGGADDAATGVICDVALALHAALRRADLPMLIPLDQRVRHLWGHQDAAGVPADLRALLGWAGGLADDLLRDRAGWTALHGDLHHFNVLHDQTRGWCAIDPKGILGPPVYDLANTLLNPLPHAAHVHNPARMVRLAGIVAERVAVPQTEVLRWTCLQACMGLAWSLHDPECHYWATGARVAGRLAGLSLPGVC